MSATADVVVIGAGVIGSSIALELARAGRRVVVVDKAGGIGHGSTSASSAIVRFNYSTWSGVALAWESLHCWRSWAEHLGHDDPAGLARFEQTGMVVLGAGDASYDATTALFDRAGVPWERWDGSDLARHLPHLDPGSYGPPKPVDSEEFFADAVGQVSGLFTPDAGYVTDPQLAAQNLGTAAQAHGAGYLLHRLVSAITRAGDDWRVTLDSGDTLDAPVVVNAAGPWSARVNEMAGTGHDFGVATRPLRQEVHHVAAPPGFNAGGPGVAVADLDLGTYARAAEGDALLVGGTEPACDPLHWLDDPDAAGDHPTVPVFTAQLTRAARRMPDLAVPTQPRGIVGVYDVASDWTPIYDRTAEPGFYVAMGTSGNQFKNAPVVGTLVRALVEAVESGHDHDADPVVVTGAHTGHPIDLGTFSRLRTVPTGAPSSVMG
jgi:glycine/D-amino acid oxidase-like deaminating enzyme